jgi:hypothetical protein
MTVTLNIPILKVEVFKVTNILGFKIDILLVRVRHRFLGQKNRCGADGFIKRIISRANLGPNGSVGPKTDKIVENLHILYFAYKL